MQDIIEKKMDLDYIYEMAQQAAEAGDIELRIHWRFPRDPLEEGGFGGWLRYP